MDLQTNKFSNPLFNEEFGQNAKVIEELARKIDWRLLTITYLKCLGLVCLTLFSIIVSIKLALSLF